MLKVILIVAGSWGVLFVWRMISDIIWPSYTKRVLKNAKPFDPSNFHADRMPDVTTNKLRFETQHNYEDEIYVDSDVMSRDKTPLL